MSTEQQSWMRGTLLPVVAPATPALVATPVAARDRVGALVQGYVLAPIGGRDQGTGARFATSTAWGPPT